jgi:hypothetical protein
MNDIKIDAINECIRRVYDFQRPPPGDLQTAAKKELDALVKRIEDAEKIGYNFALSNQKYAEMFYTYEEAKADRDKTPITQGKA